jgi:manganese/zinc/iron transport system substrate-binding protein
MLTRRAILAAPALIPFAGRALAQSPLNVVTTTGMIADAARAVGGAMVAVEGLMGPGVDPHAYRATRSDIARLARADVILYHGLGLEAQLVEVLADLARSRPVIAVAEALDPARLRAHDEYPDRFDPHVWMDPDLWRDVVGAVAAGLTTAAPAAGDVFADGAAALQAGADRLQAYSREVLATVPETARVLVTAHDAFGYFGRAYGFQVLGLQGISTESEAGVARVADLVGTLVSRQIPAVFVETSVSDRGLRALIEGAAAEGHTVAVGGELYSDAMGPDSTHEGTWIGMIDHNVTTITRALGGTAPEGGMDGRLSS